MNVDYAKYGDVHPEPLTNFRPRVRPSKRRENGYWWFERYDGKDWFKAWRSDYRREVTSAFCLGNKKFVDVWLNRLADDSGNIPVFKDGVIWDLQMSDG